MDSSPVKLKQGGKSPQVSDSAAIVNGSTTHSPGLCGAASVNVNELVELSVVWERGSWWWISKDIKTTLTKKCKGKKIPFPFLDTYIQIHCTMVQIACSFSTIICRASL